MGVIVAHCSQSKPAILEGTMPYDRRGLVVVGAFTVLMGTVIFIIATDIIPQPDEKFGAPRWIVGLFGLAFFFAGWYVLSLLLPTPRTRQVLAAATALTMLTGGAVLLTGLALGGGAAGGAKVSFGPFSLLLPAGVARGFERVMIWFFAALTDSIALAAWLYALRTLVRRHAP